ncbi:hypothetical protein BZM27_21085 [Paraburkholderia steynii]|uniref:TniQ family protein n=1 Tax=Paraburkholderia steynii TaxID=1245441 RepID=A0A4R0XA53_9BURK|nr:hypothetical protein BZM27_21085 [Paraburkholderia steynii]
MNDRLLARPNPFPDESPQGLLLRAAFLNGWRSPIEMLLAFRLRYRRSVLTDPEVLQGIFDTLGICVEASSISFNGGRDYFLEYSSRLPLSMLRADAAPVCVSCLCECDYLRREWSHRLICSCVAHMRALLFECPSCGGTLSWDRGSPSLCSCGFDLRTAKPGLASPFAVSIERAFNRRDRGLVGDLTRFFILLEEVDFTRAGADFDWSNTAAALSLNDKRSVDALVALLRRNNGSESPQRTLRYFLRYGAVTRTRALQAIRVFSEDRYAGDNDYESSCIDQ